MTPIVVDTETTGLDPAASDVLELAGVWRVDGMMQWYDSLCCPERPDLHIPAEAKAVHHIEEHMVRGKPTLEHIFRRLLERAQYVSPTILVAHNAEFDSGFLDQFAGEEWPDFVWACTYRCAMHIWPDAPGFSNQVLRYWLNLSPDLPHGLYPHRALYDAITTECLLQRMLETHSIIDLVELTKKPVLLTKVRFGKHLGEMWKDVPTGYLRWILGQDFGRDVVHTAEHYLGR